MRVLLVGRTALPPRDSWADHGGRPAAVAEKIAALRQLEGQGGEVRYEAVDVCEPDRLREAVERAEAEFGRQLDGVLHLAVPTARARWPTRRSRLSPRPSPEGAGDPALGRLLDGRPEAFFLGFSSVTSFFGGAMFGAYAAANAYLESLARHLRRHRGCARTASRGARGPGWA